MEDAVYTNGRTAGVRGPVSGFKANLKLRAIGLLYLALGYIFIRAAMLLAVYPGIFSAAETHYKVPNACFGLECIHRYERSPEGELYCTKYPPREILDSRMFGPVKKFRLICGAVLGTAGLFFAVSVLICGLLWLLGLWIPRKPARWYAVLCRLAPLIVILLWLAAITWKAIYPLRLPPG
jgi:hypothetical protein